MYTATTDHFIKHQNSVVINYENYSKTHDLASTIMRYGSLYERERIILIQL